MADPLKKKERRNPILPEDRVMQVIGWFAPPGPRDLVALHKRHVAAVAHLRAYASRGDVYGLNGETLGPKLPQNPENHGIPISPQEWPQKIDQVTAEYAARSLTLFTDGFSIRTYRCESTHFGATYPASADLFVIDDSNRLGTDQYDLSTIARAAVDALDADGNCVHALVDYDYGHGYNNCGNMYTAFPSHPMDWQSWVDFADWGTIGEAQATTVRRVVWGTYLGPRMVERLSKNFIDDFLALKDSYFGSPQTVERLSGGGIYLTLTENPRDQVEHEEFPDIYERPVVRNAAWLRQRLREAGML
jgi:hypothetical protein